MLNRIKKSRAMQVYFYMPRSKGGLLNFLYFLSVLVFVVCLVFMVTLFEYVFRPLPALEELNVTRATLKEIVDRPRGGVYLIVTDIITREDMAFPGMSGSFPIRGRELKNLRGEVGDELVLKWRYQWFPFFMRKHTWSFENISKSEIYTSYENLVKNVRRSFETRKEVFKWISIIVFFILVYPWILFRKDIK